MSLPDYHIHTRYCGHAHGESYEYVEAAIANGISQICFTDHLYRYYITRNQRREFWDWGMNRSKLKKYYSEIKELQKKYSDKIEINIGLEIDYATGSEEKLKEIISDYDFDFLLGSIHCIPEIGLKHLVNYKDGDKGETYEIYKKYFELAQMAIRSKLFSTLAHPDAIWRYIKWPNSHSDEIFIKIENLVKVAKECNVSLELNANALTHAKMATTPTGSPLIQLLNSIKSEKASFTVGSDAHNPHEVGKNFPDIKRLLTNKDISGCRTYSKMLPREFNIL